MNNRGFTLIELLVALAIFALLSLLAYGGLDSVLDTAERSTRQMDHLSALQRGVVRLVDDLEHVAARPVRDRFGDPRPALAAAPDRQPMVELTRSGWPNPAGRPRSSLQRVEYALDGRMLVRRAWNVLDQAPGSEPLEQRLLDGVLGLELRYADGEGRWQTFWPPAAADPALLPRAIEARLEVDGIGLVTRLVVPSE